MGSLQDRYIRCRAVLCAAAKRRNAITYSELAAELGLKSPRQRWSELFGPMAEEEVRRTGHDLTLVVVYKSGPAKGLGRYFSNVRGGGLPQSKTLDPSDQREVAKYKKAREEVFNRYAALASQG